MMRLPRKVGGEGRRLKTLGGERLRLPFLPFLPFLIKKKRKRRR
jgi:hypothetical protein